MTATCPMTPRKDVYNGSYHHQASPMGDSEDGDGSTIVNSSPVMSRHGLKESQLDDLEDHISSKMLEKKKRKYSQELYKWTREMLAHARQDIERRSCESSDESSRLHSESSSMSVGPDSAQPKRHPSDVDQVGAVRTCH
ncbi:hypothetical protein L204_105674 [Cryptococcus depauperatus]|nr:hypothetical protein L204_02559 [Cryptococcus depauperatus CBS 7855]